MGAVNKLKEVLQNSQIERVIIEEILSGFDHITDKSKKENRALFLIEAMNRMDRRLDFETRIKLRDECSCCKGGWREKAVHKVAKDNQNKSVKEILDVLWNVEHMGKPVLNPDGTITAGIGGDKGCPCACSIFSGTDGKQPEFEITKTYCLCCAGHFRYYYELALNKKIKTIEVLTSSLASLGKEPCLFIYEIID